MVSALLHIQMTIESQTLPAGGKRVRLLRPKIKQKLHQKASRPDTQASIAL